MALPASSTLASSASSQDDATGERAMKMRIESKLRLSMEAFGAPLSPSLPSSNGDEAAPHVERFRKAAIGGQQDPIFFSEQDFSRFSHQSELFRKRWTEHQSQLQAIYTRALQEREREQRERARAAVIAPATLSLARTVTFTTPDTAPSPSPQTPASEAKQRLQPSPMAVLSRSPSAVASNSPSLSVLPAPIARNDMDFAAQAAGVAVPRPSRTSSLSSEEHQAFLFYQQQQVAEARTKGGPPLNASELADFLQLQGRVKTEQEEYRQYILKEIMANKEAYFAYHEDIQQQIERVLASRRERVSRYPRMYGMNAAVDISTVKSAPEDPVLVHQRTLLQLGRVLNVEPPSQPTPIPVNLAVFASVSAPSPQRKRWIKKVLLLFPERLVKAHAADIALSSSVLTALVDTHGPALSETWIIPFKVVQEADPAGSPPLKTAYLDKPLLRPKLTPREKTELYYKIAVESMMLQPETKGQQLNKEPLTGESATQLADDNLTYNLWKFDDMKVLLRCKIHGVLESQASSQSQSLSSQLSQSGPQPGNKPPYRYVSMKVKLEYQPRLGQEEITLGETARWWAQTFIRPDAHLLLARVNPFESKLLQVEHKDMVAVLPPTSLFKPQQALKVILVLLRKIRSLSPGNYVLSHKPRDCYVVLFQEMARGEGKASATDAVLDLHAELATAGASDTNTVPLVHPRWNGPANQVPYTFPPPPSKHPSQALSKFKRLRYCHAFAYATCRAGTQCKFPHLTEEELEVELHKQQQVQGSSAEKLSKKGKKGKQKKAKSGGEAAPMQTEPQSPPAAAPAPSPALPARYQQAFQDLDAGEERGHTVDFASQLARHQEMQRLQSSTNASQQ